VTDDGDDDDDLWTCLGTDPGYLIHLNYKSIYLICSLTTPFKTLAL